MRVTPLCRPEQDFSRHLWHSACGACCAAACVYVHCLHLQRIVWQMRDHFASHTLCTQLTVCMQILHNPCNPRAIFPYFACITRFTFIKAWFFFTPLHNTTWCRLCFVIQHLVHRVLFAIWAGSSCLLCLQVWHSTFAVYHKNAIKIIIDTTYPLNKEEKPM